MLRARAGRLALIALAGLAGVFLAWRATPDAAAALSHARPTWLPAYLALVVIIVVLQALRWRTVLDRLGAPSDAGGSDRLVGVRPPLPLLARQWLAARAVGSLIPSGTLAGEPVRAHLLAATGVPTSSAAGAVALDRALELAGNMIAGPACVGAALALGAGSAAGAAVSSTVAGAGLAAFAFVYWRASRGRPALLALVPAGLRIHGGNAGSAAAGRPSGRGGRLLASLRAHIAAADRSLQRVATDHPRLVPAGLALSLGIEALHLVELAVLYVAFGLVVPLPLLLLSSVGIGVARAVPISAALGSLEAVQVGIFGAGGRSVAVGLSVGLVLRLAETLWILVGLACLVTAPADEPTASPARRSASAPEPHDVPARRARS